MSDRTDYDGLVGRDLIRVAGGWGRNVPRSLRAVLLRASRAVDAASPSSIYLMATRPLG